MFEFIKNLVSPKIEYYSEYNSNILFKANVEDACFDLRSIDNYTLKAKDSILVKTGLYFKLPKGWEIQIRSRSGLALKNKIFVLNSPGTIDTGYVNEVGVILYNLGNENFIINRHDRIAQAFFNKIPKCRPVNSLREPPTAFTSRGKGGFGSSGV